MYENSLPDPTQAYQHIFDNVDSQTFFSRLAAHQISPQNEKQAMSLLQLREQVRSANQAVQTKEASSDPFGQLSDQLGHVLGQQGLDTGIKTSAQQDYAEAVSDQADAYMADPAIYASTVSLKLAEAQHFASQLQ